MQILAIAIIVSVWLAFIALCIWVWKSVSAYKKNKANTTSKIYKTPAVSIITTPNSQTINNY